MRGRSIRAGKWAALGVALVVASVAVLSGWFEVWWSERSERAHTEVFLLSGRVHVRRSWTAPPWILSISDAKFGWTVGLSGEAPRWRWGFEWERRSRGMQFLSIAVPLWAVAAAAGAGAALLWRRGRRQGGRCPACGYSLKGLEGQERCPECGARAGEFAPRRAENAAAEE